VSASALADAVTHLPGLAPSAASLVALVREPADWSSSQVDPGAVLLHSRVHPSGVNSITAIHAPKNAAFFEEALRQLDRARFVDWASVPARSVHQSCTIYARIAELIAQRTGCCSPVRAWAAALLAPLGWLAMCSVSREQVSACLDDVELSHKPAYIQRRHWGIEQSGIARRLNRRWRLPTWLATVTGHLDLPADDAAALGADVALFRVVQLSVSLAQQEVDGLCLVVGATPAENAAALGIVADDWTEIEAQAEQIVAAVPPVMTWDDPTGVPLLREMLMLAADNRRLADGPGLQELEIEVDQLHRALSEQRAGEEKRLRDQKLTALAEFAAGAGHEINNPLAVISGQAQYLLADETEPSRQRSLQTMINQTHRIHQILNGLMQFARPARPRKQVTDLHLLIRDVTAELNNIAEQRRVRLTCAVESTPVRSAIDPKQIYLALECLLRNAIEAAPAEGWAGIRMETPTADIVELIVEDSGPGPTQAQREHLFDPFYSGRQAGRGRGLGLPTAWRLAREHGGDVRFDDLPQGPTRFVLSLPRHPEVVSTVGEQLCA
jgi:signal transduction histidine kinase